MFLTNHTSPQSIASLKTFWMCIMSIGIYQKHMLGVVGIITRWRHQMETFSALLANCAENSPVAGDFPWQRPVTWSFDVFFDLRLNKQLSKQSWGWWFETSLRSLWRHCNVVSSHHGMFIHHTGSRHHCRFTRNSFVPSNFMRVS